MCGESRDAEMRLLNEIIIYFPAQRVNRAYIVRIRLGTLRRETVEISM